MTASYYTTAEIKKAGALSNVTGKQEKLHIWNLDCRQQVLPGRCVAVGFVLLHSLSQQSGSFSQVPLARPVMLMKSLAQPSALAQAEMWKFLHLLQTKARLGCLHYLLNLAGSS